MRFQADESGIFRLLMGFLKEKKLFETLNSLQLEIGQADEDLGSDLLYLQRLVLQGRCCHLFLFLAVIYSGTLYHFTSRDFWYDMLSGGMMFCCSSSRLLL